MRAVAKCVALSVAMIASTAHSFSEAVPKSQITTLTGQSVTLPGPGSKKPLLLVLGFSNKSSKDVTDWNKHFKVPYALDRRVDFYELADFQGVPSFVMKMILHGMRRSVKEPERSHFAPFYSDEDQWKTLVKFNNPNIAYILLANAKGEVLWGTHGPASDAAAAELESEVVKLARLQR
jgi:hypothetical protein